MKTKLFFLFLAVMANVNILFAESGTCGDSLIWDFTDGVLIISGTGDMYDFDGWENNPFYPHHDYILSIIIGNGVTSIGSYAFMDCVELTSIEIPNTVTKISRAAFSGCRSLTSIDLPDGITTISGSVFRDCRSLTYITIPNGVTTIGGNAFDGCGSITSIVIPNGVTSIGEGAFEGCSSLASISIPNSVIKFDYPIDGYYVEKHSYGALFDEDNSLSEPVYNSHIFFYLPKNHVGEYTIPQGIEIIAEAITGCENLTAIHIPEGVKIISGYNFEGCPNLNEITLPNSITRIVGEKGAFKGSGYYNNEHNWTTENGVKALYIGTCLIEVKDFGDQTHWSIKEGTTVIADGAADRSNNYERIKSIYLPESLVFIGSHAFKKMNFKTVAILDNVRYIGRGAFAWNDSLVSLTIGKGVEEIGPDAFDLCSNLKTLVLGSGLRRIGPQFIWGCSHLSKIICKATEVPELLTWYGGGEGFVPMSASDFDNDFEGVSRKAHLCVPAEVIQDYEIHPVWGQFNTFPMTDEEWQVGLDQITDDNLPTTTKLLRDCQIVILRDDHTYTLTGQEVK